VAKFQPGEPDFNRPREMQTDVQLKVGVPIGL